MNFGLFADTEPGRGLIPFLYDSWRLLLPPFLGFVAIYLLLPRPRRLKPVWGGVLAAAAVVLGAFLFIRTETVLEETLLFYAFAGLAIAGGVMMLAQSNPVHAALSFALVVLSSCGLFLLQAAPFLMAATIIIYAGAIVVTFLFVIMLAQQEGVSSADQRSREPFLATLAGCILMASLLCILQKTYNTRDLDSDIQLLQQLTEVKNEAEVKALLGDPAPKKVNERELDLTKKLEKQFNDNDPVQVNINDLNMSWVKMRIEPLRKNARAILDRIQKARQEQGSLALTDVPGKAATPGHFAPGKLPAHNVAALGRTLFTDYLVPVELAALLLLVATIGAIVIAGRRSEELR